MRTQVENTMKKNLLPTRLGQSAGMSGLALGLALTLSACGSTQIPSSQSAGGEDGLIGGENKPNASEIIPKEAKRQISADARADFEKATKQYLEAKKSGGLSGSECRSVANAFKNAADENPALVEACADNDLVFVGPPAAVMTQMGDKVAARQAMRDAGVPTVPGTEGPTTVEAARSAAEEIGYPVL